MAAIYLLEAFDFGEKVHFYTIRREQAEQSETDQFIERFFDSKQATFDPAHQEDMETILVWMEEIGKRGMDICQLRHENAAHAFPPKRGFVSELAGIDTHTPHLRLCCVVFPPSIIVLCGGGIKTSQTYQDSPDLVGPVRLANQIAEKLTSMVVEREISIYHERKTIELPVEIWIP
ncbi:MAG: hypothetical protein AAF399_21715 [Bacteroidota bacterium]